MTPQLHCEIPPLRLLTQLLWPTLFICRWKACDQSADSIHTRPGTVKYTQHHDQPEGPGRFWPLLTTTLSGLTAQIIPLSCNLLTQHWLESSVRVKDFGLWPYFNPLEVPQLLFHLLWITAVKCIHSRKCKSLSFGWKGPLQSRVTLWGGILWWLNCLLLHRHLLDDAFRVGHSQSSVSL